MTFGMGELLLSFEKLWRETFECGWVMSLWGGVGVVWGGSFSRTAAIFDWAPLLLKTMAMMIGVKTLNIIPFLFLSTAY